MISFVGSRLSSLVFGVVSLNRLPGGFDAGQGFTPKVGKTPIPLKSVGSTRFKQISVSEWRSAYEY